LTLEGYATVLLVQDVRLSTEHYRDRLGFEVDLYDKIPEHYGYARRDRCSVYFAHWKGVQPRPNSEAVPPGMFDVYVYVDDVDALHAELVERGAEVHGPPARQGYGMVDFRVSDLDGYVLALRETGALRRGRGRLTGEPPADAASRSLPVPVVVDHLRADETNGDGELLSVLERREIGIVKVFEISAGFG
jgi:predicted enzyme related to lactoylglutathione lyase